ncbi:MAG TPA: YetF domain-containing protein [Longimicrobiaceae bacterium]|nr:YetF domain-containing protein [Longimicrobiaceae bacterium]
MQTFWQDLLVPGISAGEKIVRTVAVYGFLLVGLRLAGKREMAQLNAFDLVVLLLLSNAVQNAVIGNDNSLVGGILGAVTLLVVNYLMVRFLYAHPTLDAVVEGSAEVLVLNGQIQKHALEHNLITVQELEAVARRQGMEDLSKVSCARLEIGGTISFVMKEPSADEKRHDELLARLGALERQLGILIARERGGT